MHVCDELNILNKMLVSLTSWMLYGRFLNILCPLGSEPSWILIRIFVKGIVNRVEGLKLNDKTLNLFFLIKSYIISLVLYEIISRNQQNFVGCPNEV